MWKTPLESMGRTIIGLESSVCIPAMVRPIKTVWRFNMFQKIFSIMRFDQFQGSNSIQTVRNKIIPPDKTYQYVNLRSYIVFPYLYVKDHCS